MSSPIPCFISAAPVFHATKSNFLSRTLSPHRAPPNVRRNPHPYPPRIKMSLPLLPLSAISDTNQGPLLATSFVFFLTFWGGISFVKGSTKTRLIQAAFTLREPAPSLAKKTARHLMERSYTPDLSKDGRAGVATFTGKVRASTSVASILVAVACSGLWSASYILNFVLPESLQSAYWGWLSVLGVAVVPWYWKEANRVEEVKVMVEEEVGGLSKVFVKGHRDEIEALERKMKWKRDEPVYEGEVEKTKAA